jgi:uncharacterized membrane protein
MAVLAVLVAATLAARLAGALGAAALRSWPAAARVGLAVTLLFTASAHFTPMRHDLARMIPPAIPYPMAMVYFTGACEIAGAVGLLIPRTRRAAALALIVFFLAVLPANIHAARAGVTLRGAPATRLAVRIPMQVLFIALAWWAGLRHAERVDGGP